MLTSLMERTLNPKIEELFPNEYGEPNSLTRILKMANVISTFCNLVKRRKDALRCSVAIGYYKDDLQFLKEKYFIPMMGEETSMIWPNINEG